MKDWYRRRAADERGAVLVVVALAMTAMIGATALAVDIGQLTNNNRTLQARADVIALDAARTLGGQTSAVLSGATGATVLAVQASAARNSVPFTSLTVDLGNWSGPTFTTVATPVIDGVIQTVTDTSVPKALRITAKGTVDFAFRQGVQTTNRKAVAIQEASAGFSLGSFLVGTVTDEQNTVLNQIFGDSFSAHVISYDGLANANVSLEALGINMPVTALSPTELLNTEVRAKDLMLASAAALNDGSHTAAVGILNAMAASVSADTMVNLGDTMKVETGGEQAAAAASVNVLHMLTAAALAVDGTHAITIPQAQLSIPNVGDVGFELNVISPPVTYFGPVNGPAVTTGQVSLTITPRISYNSTQNITCSLQSVVGLLTCLLNPVLRLSIDVTAPITLTAANASATLSGINCATNTITVSPVLGALNLDTNLNVDVDAVLAGIPLNNVIMIHAAAGAKTVSTPSPVSFVNPTEFGIPKSVGSSPIGLAGLTTLSNPANISILNIGLGSLLTPVLGALLGVVNTALGAVDSVVMPLLHRLGLTIGGADITAIPGSLTCNGLRLVQ